MATPMLPMIPKTIVTLGESTDVVETNSGIDVEDESVDSDLKERKRFLRIRFDIMIVGSQVMAMDRLDTIMGTKLAFEQFKKAMGSRYLN
jgi:hypothetical protein